MEVRLTAKGQKALGKTIDRTVVTVSKDRAFAMMDSGFAVPDKRFMALYGKPEKTFGEAQTEAQKVAVTNKVDEKKPKKEIATPRKAKKENARSKKSAAGEKAVAEE